VTRGNHKIFSLHTPMINGGRTRQSAGMYGALQVVVTDALTLRLAPIGLGAGTPLFTGGAPRTLVQRSVISTSTATHLTYDVFR
jgi:hypothetical protein